MRRTIVLASALGFVTACGNDSRPGDFSSSIEPSRQLDSLEPAELVMLCEEGLEFVDLEDVFLRVSCLFTAFEAAGTAGGFAATAITVCRLNIC